MKYFKGALVASDNKENWIECDICKTKHRTMNVTIDNEKICDKCIKNDLSAKFVDDKYGDK